MEGGHSVVSSSKTWIEQELSRCEFKDLRHGKRLEKLLGQFSDEIGGSIPWACQDWANTKAAYRFLANGRVNEAAILSGHFQATQERCSAAQGKKILFWSYMIRRSFLTRGKGQHRSGC